MFFELIIQDLKFSHFEDLTTVPTTASIATEHIIYMAKKRVIYFLLKSNCHFRKAKGVLKQI